MQARTPSPLSSGKSFARKSMWLETARWGMMTPLGTPVEPEVNSTIAGSSSPASDRPPASPPHSAPAASSSSGDTTRAAAQAPPASLAMSAPATTTTGAAHSSIARTTGGGALSGRGAYAPPAMSTPSQIAAASGERGSSIATVFPRPTPRAARRRAAASAAPSSAPKVVPPAPAWAMASAPEPARAAPRRTMPCTGSSAPGGHTTSLVPHVAGAGGSAVTSRTAALPGDSAAIRTASFTPAGRPTVPGTRSPGCRGLVVIIWDASVIE
mmetsp:Transcript_66445/g.210307  ORF Transcript_66445/g.210307 Transcript_66445/m.210307 type:complete len:269 (+) Transcript_66445:3115-3921(+)